MRPKKKPTGTNKTNIEAADIPQVAKRGPKSRKIVILEVFAVQRNQNINTQNFATNIASCDLINKIAVDVIKAARHIMPNAASRRMAVNNVMTMNTAHCHKIKCRRVMNNCR